MALNADTCLGHCFAELGRDLGDRIANTTHFRRRQLDLLQFAVLDDQGLQPSEALGRIWPRPSRRTPSPVPRAPFATSTLQAATSASVVVVLTCASCRWR